MVDMPASKKEGLIGVTTYVSAAAATTIAAATTAVKAAGTFATRMDANGVTVTTSNKVTYDGVQKRNAMFRFNGTVNVATADDNVTVEIWKNGAEVVGASASILSVTSVATFDFSFMDEISLDDYFEIYLVNEDTTANLTLNLNAELSLVA